MTCMKLTNAAGHNLSADDHSHYPVSFSHIISHHKIDDWLIANVHVNVCNHLPPPPPPKKKKKKKNPKKQEGHDGPVSLHWLIREIHSYQTLHYLGIGLKHKTPYKD